MATAEEETPLLKKPTLNDPPPRTSSASLPSNLTAEEIALTTSAHAPHGKALRQRLRRSETALGRETYSREIHPRPAWRGKSEDVRGDPSPPPTVTKPVRVAVVLWELYIEAALGLFNGWLLKTALINTINHLLFGDPIRYDNEEIHATLDSDNHPLCDILVFLVFALVAAGLVYMIARFLPLPVCIKTVLSETCFCVPLWSLKQELSSSLDTMVQRSGEERLLFDILAVSLVFLACVLQIVLEYLTAPRSKAPSEEDQSSIGAQFEHNKGITKARRSITRAQLGSPQEHQLSEINPRESAASTTVQPEQYNVAAADGNGVEEPKHGNYIFYLLIITRMSLAFSVGFIVAGMYHFFVPWAHKSKLWFDVLSAIVATIFFPLVQIAVWRCWWGNKRASDRITINNEASLSGQSLSFIMVTCDFTVAFFWQGALETLLAYYIAWTLIEFVAIACAVTLLATFIMIILGLIHEYVIHVNELLWTTILVSAALTIAWTWMDFICNTVASNVTSLRFVWLITVVALLCTFGVAALVDLWFICVPSSASMMGDKYHFVDYGSQGRRDTSDERVEEYA